MKNYCLTTVLQFTVNSLHIPKLFILGSSSHLTKLIITPANATQDSPLDWFKKKLKELWEKEFNFIAIEMSK